MLIMVSLYTSAAHACFCITTDACALPLAIGVISMMVYRGFWKFGESCTQHESLSRQGDTMTQKPHTFVLDADKYVKNHFSR